MIEVSHASKAFGEITALSDASFSAQSGRITGLLGGNGAGKTTLMRLITTLLLPDRGQVRVDGLDVTTEALAVRRRLGVLPHSTALYPRLTGYENIAYFARLNGLGGAALEARIASLSERLGLAPFIERRAKGYSHGQRTRVALARALVHDPQYLILDEPSSGLDVGAARALRTTLRELRDEGRCIVLSSHLMHEVAHLCDEVVMLAAGRVVASGPLPELVRRSGAADAEEAFVRLTENAE